MHRSLRRTTPLSLNSYATISSTRTPNSINSSPPNAFSLSPPLAPSSLGPPSSPAAFAIPVSSLPSSTSLTCAATAFLPTTSLSPASSRLRRHFRCRPPENSKTGLLVDARKMFDEMPHRNLATWNAYISNDVLDGRSLDVVGAFKEFLCVNGEPNSITFCAFLNACSNTSSLELRRQLHGFVILDGYREDVSVLNGLVDFYGKCGDIVFAEMVFSRIGWRNVVSWCSMLAALVQNHEEERACMVFMRAREEGVEPTDFMISSMISACAELGGLELGRTVHALAVKACVDENIFVGSALVDMYGK
ncbi:Pentatricopeptide repeat-containing protein [Stylosanthes scabra]|uniref:Pentatricopeptide repeat-containing protein n=1 Tax=Stylosanthes scabra TaxID=79078 RepID=A0ABU6WQL9_9FABA|nr:Pentatricopeptide repeat-containing protein [Stylosanthes scabra]